MNAGSTVRLYSGGPLWDVVRTVSDETGSACVLCVRKSGQHEMAIYRACDLVCINALDVSGPQDALNCVTNRLLDKHQENYA